MGHFGDKLGRKKILLLTLGIMGLASLGIGCLPTYEQVGVWAPILLVAGRLAQGFSAGAESAGASTLTLEHSPEGKRGFFTSFVMTGYASGMVLATLVFIPVAAMPQEAMMSWGWRIPFWLSIVVLAIAYWVRTHLDETPVFEEAQEHQQVAPMPVKEVLKFQAPDVLRVVGMSIMSVMQTIFTVFGLAYATSTAGFDRASILTVNAVAIGLSMFAMPLAAKLSDRIGRRPVLLTAAIGCSITIFLYFLALSSGNIVLVFLAAFLNMTVLYSGFNGIWPSFFAEQFAAPVRYTGMAMGNQLGLVLAGFAPMIAGMLLAPGVAGWVPVAVFATVCMLIAAVRCSAPGRRPGRRSRNSAHRIWRAPPGAGSCSQSRNLSRSRRSRPSSFPEPPGPSKEMPMFVLSNRPDLLPAPLAASGRRDARSPAYHTVAAGKQPGSRRARV